MNRLTYAIALAAVAAVLAGPARAEAPAAQTFGVVDTSKVLQTTDAAKSISDALEAKRKSFAAEVSKEQDALRAAGQKFEKEQAGLPKSESDAKRKDLNEKFYALQKLMQNREGTLERALAESKGKLKTETAKVVGEIAKEKGLSAVLTQDAVMLFSPSMDITDEVVKRLNDRVKKISIDWDEASKKKKAG